MYEIAYSDESGHPVFVCFDGRVVEIFRGRLLSSDRQHIALMTELSAEGPNRKGIYDVRLGKIVLRMQAEGWAQMQPMLAHLQSARAEG